MLTENIDSVRNSLVDIIVNDLDVNIQPSEIGFDDSLYDDGVGLDSIAIVNFIVLVEDKFNIKFEEGEITGKIFSSINNLADFVSQKVKIHAESSSN